MHSASEPLVSIVTPVYNEAPYLAECIESVLSQRYRNWDYTIVDNCSTDGSAEIARRFAAQDRRIRVIENRQFLPAVANHNAAVRQISAHSKYCKVVLGDDWMFPECLERMVAVAEQYPSAGVVGAYALEGTRVSWTGLPYTSVFVSGREICRKHFLDKLYVFGTATTVLYRADLVRSRDPFYNEENIHADTEACFALMRTSDFGFVHQVLTFTRVRPRSLSAMSSDMHTDYPGTLQLLVTYGPDYLRGEELKTCVDRHVSSYYRFLARSALQRRRERRFWNYHSAKLAAAGIGFSRVRLSKVMLAETWSAALNPKQTVEKLLASRMVRKPGDSERDRRVAELFSRETQ